MQSFQMYVDILDMIMELNPALFRFAAQKLKNEKFVNFEL